MQRVTSAKGGSECTGYKEVSEEKNKFFPSRNRGNATWRMSVHGRRDVRTFTSMRAHFEGEEPIRVLEENNLVKHHLLNFPEKNTSACGVIEAKKSWYNFLKV